MTEIEETPAADGWTTEEMPIDNDGGGQQLVTIDVPEVKLFGKWSLNEVEVNDISLVVC